MRPTRASDDAEDRLQDATEEPRRTIGIAEHAITTEGTPLATNGLGSCVGVALFDLEAEVAGLVHVMLPTANGEVTNQWKYADTGVEALVERVVDEGADPDRLRAKIVGGSDMLEFDSLEEHVGRQNVEAIRGILQRLLIPVTAADVGGDYGRSLEVDPTTGVVTVTTSAFGERTL